MALPRIADATEAVDWSLTAASRPLSPDVSDGIEHLLATLDPDVVHVLNLVRLPLDIPELATQQGLPVIRSVTGTDDLCGLVIPVSPVSPGQRGVRTAPVAGAVHPMCAAATWPALAASYAPHGPTVGRPGDDVIAELLERKRARAVHHYRDVFDRVIFPSAAFRVMFEQSLPLDATKVREIEMGIDLEPWGGSSAASARSVRARRACTGHLRDGVDQGGAEGHQRRRGRVHVAAVGVARRLEPALPRRRRRVARRASRHRPAC